MNSNYVITLGHAVGSETGGHNGKAGNQNGKELRFQNWYNRSQGWSFVIRAKSSKHRKLLADAMEKAVRNQDIGYGQADRTSLYKDVYTRNFDPSKTTKPVNCDCSSLVSVCVNYAGIPLSKDVYTGNLASCLRETGKFTIYVSDAYIKSYNKLKRGDIILGSGHVAIVVNDIYWLKSIIRMGTSKSRPNDVKAIQSRLNELQSLLGKRLTVDGEWGAKTEERVREFQKNNGLVVDGIIGKATAEALGFLYA